MNILRDSDRTYTTIPEIAEKLAQTFSQISSNDNYTDKFSRYERDVEQESISFNGHNAESYNKPFSLGELKYSMSRTKNTAPGCDEVHYQMLKEMQL